MRPPSNAVMRKMHRDGIIFDNQRVDASNVTDKRKITASRAEQKERAATEKMNHLAKIMAGYARRHKGNHFSD